MTTTPTTGSHITHTCLHPWHNAEDGFPTCKGETCTGRTVACGQGLIDCPRHARPTAPARALTAADEAEITNRLAGTVARRVATTGEDFATATTRVLSDFTAEWPTVAAAMVARRK